MTADSDIVDFNSAMSAFESKHFSTAMNLLKPFAEKGNPDAFLCPPRGLLGTGEVGGEGGGGGGKEDPRDLRDPRG